jgi:hypothetical protein
MTAWRTLGAFDAARLTAARLQAHRATQWLARAARAYIPARPEDAHTNLGWDDAFGGLLTHPLPDGAMLGLRVADLALAVLGAAGTDTFALAHRRDTEVRDWLGRLAQQRGLDATKLDDALPYEPPSIPGDAYVADGPALDELAAWFANGHAAVAAIRAQIAARGLEAPPVRCWPHHFDMDTLVTVAPGRTTGIGFEPGDGYYGEPYFYVSIYPVPVAATLPTLPAVGHWHTDRFTAAIATASRIVVAKDQEAAVEEFLRVASGAAVKALRP